MSILGERYRFKIDHEPSWMSETQKRARAQFLKEIHLKNRYSILNRCPYCGYTGFSRISEIGFTGLPSDIVVCDSCDGCFKRNILDQAANRYHYEKISYVLRGKSPDGREMEELFQERLSSFAYPRYEFISSFVKVRPADGAVVEFGCGDGANLFPWKERGFEVIGVDLDGRFIRFGSDKGLNIRKGDIVDHDICAGKAKLIILSHVLEHVPDINEALASLSKVMASDGRIFIESPGIRSHGIADPLRYFDVEHNYNFDMDSMSRLLGSHKLKVIYADEYIRFICAKGSGSNVRAVASYPVLSINAMAAVICRSALKIMQPNKKKICALLGFGEAHRVIIKLINKVQMLYFRFYYSSFCGDGK